MNYTIKQINNGKDFMVVYPVSDSKLQDNTDNDNEDTGTI